MSLAHAILGFLELEPTTGYTLLQRFEGSVGSFWSATQSQVYRELHALEAQGKVSAKVVPQAGKPSKKVYSLTSEGKRALVTWLEAPLEPMQLRDPLQLKLVFSATLDPKRLDAHLKAYGVTLDALLEEYRGRLKAIEIFALARSAREKTVWSLSIESGIAWAEGQRAWVERARRRLSSKRSAP